MFQPKSLKQLRVLCKIMPQDYAPTYKLIDMGRKCSIFLYSFSLFWCKTYWDFKRKIILIWDFQSRSHPFFFVKHFISSALKDPWKASFKEQSFQNTFGNGKASFQDCNSKDVLQTACNKLWIKHVISKKKMSVLIFSAEKIWIKIFWAVLPLKESLWQSVLWTMQGNIFT